MKFDLKKLNGKDLSKLVYPITIFLTGIYIISSLNQMIMGWGRGLMAGITLTYYMVSFTLIPIGFVYLAWKKIKLEFKWSILSVIGIMLIIVFSHDFIEYLSSGPSFSEMLNIGADHWLFPIAFGFFYLCNLNKIPKRFWHLLLPFALFAFFMGNAILIVNSISNSNMFQVIGGPNFPFVFFGANNWQEVSALPTQRFIDGLEGLLHELLTFFTLLPIVIIYYTIRKNRLRV